MPPHSALVHKFLDLVQQNGALAAELLLAIRTPRLGHGPAVALPLGDPPLALLSPALGLLRPGLGLLASLLGLLELLVVVPRAARPAALAVAGTPGRLVIAGGFCFCTGLGRLLVLEHELAGGMQAFTLLPVRVTSRAALTFRRLLFLRPVGLLVLGLLLSLDLGVLLLQLGLVNQVLLNLGDCAVDV